MCKKIVGNHMKNMKNLKFMKTLKLMKNLKFLTVYCLTLCSLLFFTGQVQAKNVILIIGDGMDDHQITAARNYLYGAQGKTILDDMPLRSAVQVITVSEQNPEQVVYVADSANSATSMATGIDTSMGRIATSAKDDKDLKTIIELAQAAGLKTGIVTTSSITDATPASFIAHISQRDCESSKHMVQYRDKIVNVIDCANDTKQKGGKGSIAEQLADSQVDVLLGGGRKHFIENNEAKSKTILQQAKDNNFVVIDSLTQAEAIDNNQKLLGLFSEKHLPVRMRGTHGGVAKQAEFSFLNSLHRYLGSVDLPEVMLCENNPDFLNTNTPHLKELTALALKRLQNEKGFFLMIESASIDKQSHIRQPCGSIGEAEQLFESVTTALEFAKQSQQETLILVTADHGQAAQIVPDGSMYEVYGVPVASPGRIARIQTPEGAIMVMNYATNQFDSEEHTGTTVPLFANQQIKDQDGNDMIKSFIQQKDIFSISKSFLGL